jgi:hypothetical protein
VDGSFYGSRQQFAYQLLGVLVVTAYCLVATSLIFLLLRHTIGLRVSPQQEIRGLDSAMHMENDKYTHAAINAMRPGMLPQFNPEIADPASVSLVMSTHGPSDPDSGPRPAGAAAAASTSSQHTRITQLHNPARGDSLGPLSIHQTELH